MTAAPSMNLNISHSHIWKLWDPHLNVDERAAVQQTQRFLCETKHQRGNTAVLREGCHGDKSFLNFDEAEMKRLLHRDEIFL